MAPTKTHQSKLSELFAALLSIIVGAATWFGMRMITGEQDPQSHLNYWIVGYPILVFASLLIGFQFNTRPWRWGALIIAVQLVLGISTAKGGLNLLPLGVLLHVLLALPCVLAANFGSWIAKKRNQKYDQA
jgi:hypothetical protein